MIKLKSAFKLGLFRLHRKLKRFGGQPWAASNEIAGSNPAEARRHD